METTIELKGMHTDSRSSTVESEFSQRVGVQIGAKIKILSGSMSKTG